MKSLILLYALAATALSSCANGAYDKQTAVSPPLVFVGPSVAPSDEAVKAANQSQHEKYCYILRMKYYNQRATNNVSTIPPLMLYHKWTSNRATRSPFLVTNGERAYYMDDGNVMKIELRTGKSGELCKMPLKYAAFALSADGRLLYCSGGSTRVGFGQATFSPVAMAIDTQTGKTEWRIERDAADPFYPSLLSTDDGTLILVAQSRIMAVDGKNGKEIWTTCILKGPWAPYMVETAGVIAFCGPNNPGVEPGVEDHRIFGVDAKSGKLLWTVASKNTERFAGLLQADEKRFYLTQPPFPGKPQYITVIDAKTGETLSPHCDPVSLPPDQPLPGLEGLLPDGCGGVQRIGDWEITYERSCQYIVRNLRTGIQYKFGEGAFPPDANLEIVEFAGNRFFTAIDGYLILPLGGIQSYTFACFEDARFHPDSTRMLFDLRPEMLDEKMKTRIAELVKELGPDNYDTRSAAVKELTSLLDLPEEQVRAALKGEPSPGFKVVCENILKSIEKYKELRKYLDELGCRKDPIYFTALIRHTADLEIQQKAIDRLKKITGQDFGLKPSAEWIKDQKEASDKYDDWWLKNRDKIAWSDKGDRYIPK
jgi:hypothetical protein